MSVGEGVSCPQNVCNVSAWRGTSPPKMCAVSVGEGVSCPQNVCNVSAWRGTSKKKKCVQCQWVKGYLVPKMCAMSVHEGVSYPKNVCNVTTQQGYLVPKMCVMSTHEGVLNPYTSSQNYLTEKRWKLWNVLSCPKSVLFNNNKKPYQEEMKGKKWVRV